METSGAAKSESKAAVKPASEKRRYQRYGNQNLSLQVSRPGVRGMLRSNPSGKCLNFSRTGLLFNCAQPLKDGEPLVIDIFIDDIILRDVAAKVVSKQRQEDGAWCHGARFCLEQRKMQKEEIYRNLLLIEEKLKNCAEFPFNESEM